MLVGLVESAFRSRATRLFLTAKLSHLKTVISDWDFLNDVPDLKNEILRGAEQLLVSTPLPAHEHT